MLLCFDQLPNSIKINLGHLDNLQFIKATNTPKALSGNINLQNPLDFQKVVGSNPTGVWAFLCFCSLSNVSENRSILEPQNGMIFWVAN